MFTKILFAVCSVSILCSPTSSIAEPQANGECVVLYPPGMAPTPPDGYGDPKRMDPFSPNVIRRVLIAAHFNGVTWNHFPEARLNGIYESMSFRRNFMVAVGWGGSRAVALRGLR
jgi:hypothetical protein